MQSKVDTAQSRPITSLREPAKTDDRIIKSNEQLYCFKMGSEADDTVLNTNAGGCKPTPICMNHVGPKWQVEQIRGFYVYVHLRQ